MSVKRGGKEAAGYGYDLLDRRVRKMEDGHRTRYIYDGLNILMEEDEGGKVLARYLNGAGIDEPLLKEIAENKEKQYYLQDGLGSISAVVDGRGRIKDRYRYSSFGSARNGIGRIGFTGREYDSAAGLYYYRARYYNPILGRFTQPDPLGMPDGINRYVYCLNNPVNWVDPWGLDATSWFGDGRSLSDGPKNGNYGGKNWTGGWNPNNHEGVTGHAGPTDSADVIYALHDFDWTDADKLSTEAMRKSARAAADRKLIESLKQLDKDPRKWPNPPRRGTEKDSAKFRDWALWWFGSDDGETRCKRSK